MANVDCWVQPLAIWILPGRESPPKTQRMTTVLTRLVGTGTRAAADNVRDVHA